MTFTFFSMNTSNDLIIKQYIKCSIHYEDSVCKLPSDNGLCLYRYVCCCFLFANPFIIYIFCAIDLVEYQK